MTLRNYQQACVRAITADEQHALSQAQQCGFLVRSGQRVAVLRAWRRRCAEADIPCVVVIQGARQDVVEVDGRVVEKTRSGEGEARASALILELKRGELVV